MKTTVLALLVGLSSVGASQARPATHAKASEGPATELTIDQLRTYAARVGQLRAEPDSLRLHVGQTIDLTNMKVIVVDNVGRQLGYTRAFDFAVKPGEPASVRPKRITGERLGETVLTLRFPRAAWSGAPEIRPSVAVPVTVIR